MLACLCVCQLCFTVSIQLNTFSSKSIDDLWLLLQQNQSSQLQKYDGVIYSDERSPLFLCISIFSGWVLKNVLNDWWYLGIYRVGVQNHKEWLKIPGYTFFFSTSNLNPVSSCHLTIIFSKFTLPYLPNTCLNCFS